MSDLALISTESCRAIRCAGLAWITEALLQQGTSDDDIRLVMGENVAPVLGQVVPG